MNGSDMFSDQKTSGGTVAGARLEGTLFVQYGMGIAFIDENGRFWQLRLAQNPNGSTFIGDDGKPTLELIEVGV
jgi:hypothetical protein